MDGLVPVVGITPPIEKVLESRDDFWFIYFFFLGSATQLDYINIRAFAPLFWPKPRVLDDPVLLSPPVVG